MTTADSQPKIDATASPVADQLPVKPPRQRAAFYVDGFNTYHALHDLGQPFLKWLNLAEVARHLVAGKPEDVVRIVFCTAIRTDDNGRMTRHRLYLRALEGAGVTVVEGYFADEERNCRNCGHNWKHPTEKEGDTSLAITIIDDAHRDIFDVAYLLTSDGDQAPVARMIRTSFPSKRLITVAPPERKHNHKILAVADGNMKLTPALTERCLFPRGALDSRGNIIIRPTDYDPPLGWVHPKDRPAKK
jgi:hypothetical protein